MFFSITEFVANQRRLNYERSQINHLLPERFRQESAITTSARVKTKKTGDKNYFLIRLESVIAYA
jgi:hypothetical protein